MLCLRSVCGGVSASNLAHARGIVGGQPTLVQDRTSILRLAIDHPWFLGDKEEDMRTAGILIFPRSMPCLPRRSSGYTGVRRRQAISAIACVDSRKCPSPVSPGVTYVAAIMLFELTRKKAHQEMGALSRRQRNR